MASRIAEGSRKLKDAKVKDTYVPTAMQALATRTSLKSLQLENIRKRDVEYSRRLVRKRP